MDKRTTIKNDPEPLRDNDDDQLDSQKVSHRINRFSNHYIKISFLISMKITDSLIIQWDIITIISNIAFLSIFSMNIIFLFIKSY
jgi:hypothetical protein